MIAHTMDNRMKLELKIGSPIYLLEKGTSFYIVSEDSISLTLDSKYKGYRVTRIGFVVDEDGRAIKSPQILEDVRSS